MREKESSDKTIHQKMRQSDIKSMYLKPLVTCSLLNKHYHPYCNPNNYERERANIKRLLKPR